MLKVLVACEESQVMCKAFRELGHEAYSNDLIECSGGHPEWHLQMDCFDAIALKKWDLLVAHPPCTYLANSGARWLFEKEGRWQKLDEAIIFFKKLLSADVPHIAIENPIPHKWATEKIGRYNQKVQPYNFGDKQKKSICLWLKNLPPLVPTTPELKPPTDKNEVKKWEIIWRMPPGPDQAKKRSKTFEGFANACAKQWSEYILNLKKMKYNVIRISTDDSKPINDTTIRE